MFSRLSQGCKFRFRLCLPLSLSWIEILAQAVADEVEGEHGERDGDAGKDQGVGRELERLQTARLFDHYTP